jgi:hypothetical protein
MFADPKDRTHFEKITTKREGAFSQQAVDAYEALEDAFVTQNPHYDPTDPIGRARAQWQSWESVGKKGAAHETWMALLPEHVANPGALPEGFEGFERPEPAARGANPLLQLSEQLHDYAETRDASRLLKPAALALIDQRQGISHFRKAHAWAVHAPVASLREAERVARSVQSALVAKRSLDSSDPFLHHQTLYVNYTGGIVELAAEPEAERDTSKPDLKHALLYHAKSIFGERGAALAGSDGDYRLAVAPALKKHRGVFKQTLLRAPTLEGLRAELDAFVAQVDPESASE